ERRASTRTGPRGSRRSRSRASSRSSLPAPCNRLLQGLSARDNAPFAPTRAANAQVLAVEAVASVTTRAPLDVHLRWGFRASAESARYPEPSRRGVRVA